ncbi:NADH-quinone oxidoreductase subunit L [Longimycelium tulufanense]|uniref:NADH-quinone oxidoreductase subunit L n=1 Tax=Longimycelium tulufanense TaxID=907463 RepID=A0A8J3FTP3_9PSEU|nr:proton-conducting transporter membrane subunit [Longimycelium tulufanense]GGM50990.1 NADH-quinone oxidoreductase subunit L [Longimycelium tulufanense]
MSAVLWLLPGLPLLAGGVLCVVGRRGNRAAAPVAVAVLAATLGLAAWAAVVRPSARVPFMVGLPLRLAVDDLSALMIVTVAAVTLLVLLYSVAEFAADEASARFFGLVLLFAGAMLLTVSATSLLPLLMAWEVMGATSYALIAFWWRDTWRVRTATTAFLTTRAADLGLYVAAGAAFAAVGSLDLGALATVPAPWLHVVAGGVLLAAAGKSAQLPFSFWLSGAMAGPSPVSALLHSATMVAAGAYLLLRLSPLLHSSGWGAGTTAWLGALTALVLGAVACVQRDLKQLLAASTSAQVGLMVLAAGTGAVSGGALHLATHAAVKSLLFLTAGVWLVSLGSQDLARLAGAARRWPLVGAAFAVGALSLAGIPPLAMWVSKDLALANADPGLWTVALAAAALSAVYAGRALFGVVGQAWNENRTTVGHPTRLAVAVLVVLAVPSAGLGVAALVVPDLPADVQGFEILASVVVAPAALLAAWAWTRQGAPLPTAAATWGERWLGLRALAERFVARPTHALARALAVFDDRVVAGAVSALGRGGRQAASAFDGGAERAVRGLVDAVGYGARKLGRAARRPQTGQLHQYYAQAAVALVLVAVLIVLVV